MNLLSGSEGSEIESRGVPASVTDTTTVELITASASALIANFRARSLRLN